VTEVRALRAYAEVSLGRQRSPQHDTGPHMTRYLRAANVKDGFLDLNDVKTMNFDPKEKLQFGLRHGDILVTEGSGSIGAVGAAAVWQGEISEVVCFQNTLLRLRPRPSTDPRFLGWWCRHAFADGLFASIATGANIYHISAERVRALRMTYLPVTEQRAIADYLDAETARVDALIAKKQQLIHLLNERLAALTTEVLTSTGDEIRSIRLRRLSIAACDGPFGSAIKSDHYAETGARVVRLGNIGFANWINDDAAYLDLDYFSSLRRHSVKPGDLLIAGLGDKKNPVGRATVAPDSIGPALVKADCYRIRLRGAHPKFVAYCLSSGYGRPQSARLADGSTRQRLTLGKALSLRIPDIPEETQRAIATYLDAETADINVLVGAVSNQLDLLTEHRQALITAAVTGEFQVPGAS